MRMEEEQQREEGVHSEVLNPLHYVITFQMLPRSSAMYMYMLTGWWAPIRREALHRRPQSTGSAVMASSDTVFNRTLAQETPNE